MNEIPDIQNREVMEENDDTQEFAEILNSLPEGYRKALHGAAIGMKLALDIEKKETA